MSKALDYLVKTRPEAFGHYFAFLKDCGRHLDPKTRNLISVITKVHAQTENGLKQYVRRALRDGATPTEVLDALLMAFPALGLAKIVWAVDILLEMDVGFVMPGAPAEAAWHDVIVAADLPRGGAMRADSDGRSVFVLHGDDGDWRVYDSRCPHQGTTMPHLALDGLQLTCPKHGWSFDLVSGRCTGGGDSPLRRFDSRVEQGRVQAHW